MYKYQVMQMCHQIKIYEKYIKHKAWLNKTRYGNIYIFFGCPVLRVSNQIFYKILLACASMVYVDCVVRLNIDF